MTQRGHILVISKKPPFSTSMLVVWGFCLQAGVLGRGFQYQTSVLKMSNWFLTRASHPDGDKLMLQVNIRWPVSWTSSPRAHHVFIPAHTYVGRTAHDPTDCSPPGSSVHGILYAGMLEWAPIPLKHIGSDLKELPGYPLAKARLHCLHVPSSFPTPSTPKQNSNW